MGNKWGYIKHFVYMPIKGILFLIFSAEFLCTVNQSQNAVLKAALLTVPKFESIPFYIYGEAIADHLRFSLGIISGLEIICGPGSFARLYSLLVRL